MKKFLFKINDFNDPIWKNRSVIQSIKDKKLFVHAINEEEARKLAHDYFKKDRMQSKTNFIDYSFLPFLEIGYVDCDEVGNSESENEKIEII